MEAASHRRSGVDRTVRAARAESARRAVGTLVPGAEVLILTHGQFSIIDALAAILDQTGPADVSISTWTAAAADLTHAERWVRSGRIRSLRFLVDRSFATRQPGYCQVLLDLFGPDAIRTTRTHAKFATVRNDSSALAIRTSMNLNANPRLETLEISVDVGLADFLDEQFSLFFAAPAGDMNGALPTARRPVAPGGGVSRVGRVTTTTPPSAPSPSSRRG